MNKQIEALKMAIAEIEGWIDHAYGYSPEDSADNKAIQACKKALAEAEKQEIGEAEIRQMLKDIEYYQKRVEELEQPAPMQMNQTLECPSYLHGMKSYHPAPSWQSLSDDEIDNIWSMNFEFGFRACARAIEQALKEKNT